MAYADFVFSTHLRFSTVYRKISYFQCTVCCAGGGDFFGSAEALTRGCLRNRSEPFFIPALIGQNESNAKINHLYKSAAQVIGEADGVIYMNAAVRNVGIAYLGDESIQDFMLAQDPRTSATLWGINKPRSEAYSVQALGKLAVVSYPGDAEHYPVVEAQEGNGCVELEHYESSSFGITVLDCS